MRTPFRNIAGVLALALIAGCTVKDVEPPSLAGPSTLAKAITLTASKSTLTQNGVDFVDIQVTSTGPNGQSQNIPLRAEIFVGGAVQDYGTLSTKSPVTPATIRYTAPNASPLAAGQVAQTVTIKVTPTDSGDFGNEIARELDLQLVPQGVILPINPNLVPAFTVTPPNPMAFQTATFDASTTTNGGTACNNLCSYAWNFGDGTTASGLIVTHDFRTVAVFQVTLTVTDSRGAQVVTTKAVTIGASALPTVDFTFSPTPAYAGQDIFFNAESSKAIPPRTIVSYGWNLGDGRTASGYTIARSYSNVGTYTVTLRVTDDAGATATASKTVTVTSPTPVASFTVTPSSPTTSDNVVFNASASTGPSPIVTYSWNFGSGATPATASGQVVNTRYTSLGAKAVTLTVTDSQGRTGSVTQTVTVQ
jgi:PKD repeat protein